MLPSRWAKRVGTLASPKVVCAIERGKATVQNNGEILYSYGLSMDEDDELAIYLLNNLQIILCSSVFSIPTYTHPGVSLRNSGSDS